MAEPTSLQGAHRKENTNASALVTQKELDDILRDLRKIDPGAKFIGNGRYVSLQGSFDWNREQKRRMSGVFQAHGWKVKI